MVYLQASGLNEHIKISVQYNDGTDICYLVHTTNYFTHTLRQMRARITSNIQYVFAFAWKCAGVCVSYTCVFHFTLQVSTIFILDIRHTIARSSLGAQSVNRNVCAAPNRSASSSKWLGVGTVAKRAKQ